jgi:regulation of enolase protein 1 (concanavalin A-like superfamily)
MSFVQTVDGGFAMTGSTFSYGMGKTDLWLVKTTADGTVEWNRTYGGIDWDVAHSLIQTVDGGFVMTGGTYSFGVGNADLWLVKTTADGTTEWNRTYGGTNYEVAYSLIQTVDGGFTLAGTSNSYGAGDHDFWLVKTTADGTMEWQKTYGGINSDVAHTIVRVATGGFALAGSTFSYGAGQGDFWLMATTSITNTAKASGLEAHPLLFAVLILAFWHGRKKGSAIHQKKG